MAGMVHTIIHHSAYPLFECHFHVPELCRTFPYHCAISTIFHISTNEKRAYYQYPYGFR